jgi:hypothetical protein
MASGAKSAVRAGFDNNGAGSGCHSLFAKFEVNDERLSLTRLSYLIRRQNSRTCPESGCVVKLAGLGKAGQDFLRLHPDDLAIAPGRNGVARPRVGQHRSAYGALHGGFDHRESSPKFLVCKTRSLAHLMWSWLALF